MHTDGLNYITEQVNDVFYEITQEFIDDLYIQNNEETTTYEIKYFNYLKTKYEQEFDNIFIENYDIDYVLANMYDYEKRFHIDIDDKASFILSDDLFFYDFVTHYKTIFDLNKEDLFLLKHYKDDLYYELELEIEHISDINKQQAIVGYKDIIKLLGGRDEF